MKRFHSVLLVASLFVALYARAEEIALKDGSKISGKIIGVNGETFLVKTNYGEMSVPRSDIVSISFPENSPKKDADDGSMPAIDEDLKDGTYVNRTGSFKLSVPTGWQIAPAMRTNKDIVAALDYADETLFFMVTPEKFVGTLTTYKVLAATHSQKTFSDYAQDSEAETQIDGQKGLRIVWHGTSNVNQAKFKFLVYIIPYEGRMVRLSFFTLAPLFDDAVPTFEKMALSYRSTGTSQ